MICVRNVLKQKTKWIEQKQRFSSLFEGGTSEDHTDGGRRGLDDGQKGSGMIIHLKTFFSSKHQFMFAEYLIDGLFSGITGNSKSISVYAQLSYNWFLLFAWEDST